MSYLTLMKRTFATLLYSGGILFALYLAFITFTQINMFDINGLIMSSLFFCIPMSLATILVVSTVEDKHMKYKVTRIFVFCIFLFYCFLLYVILLHRGIYYRFPSEFYSYHYSWYNVNLIPFKTIISYIVSFNNGTLNRNIPVENILGNLLLFSPMGIFLPSLFSSLKRFKKFTLTLLGFLFLIELVQFITCLGSFDIDDIILNLSGAIVFYKICKMNIVQMILKKLNIPS